MSGPASRYSSRPVVASSRTEAERRSEFSEQSLTITEQYIHDQSFRITASKSEMSPTGNRAGSLLPRRDLHCDPLETISALTHPCQAPVHARCRRRNPMHCVTVCVLNAADVSGCALEAGDEV